MKKKILTAVALIAALVLSLFMVACGDDGVGTVKFKVTAKYNAEQGVVTVADADGKQKTEFGAGANVVVTVTAKEGYELDAFTVNGVGAELTNGVYGFVISANTLVEATFKQSGGDNPNPGGDNPNPGGDEKTPEELFAEAFESVKTTFMAVGSYTYKEEGAEAVTYNLSTVFGTGAVNIIEINADGEVEYDAVYVDKDGKLAQPYHTINNEIAYNYPTKEEPFADYDNPFKKLSATDFKATATKNVFALNADDDVLTAAATAITGWNESIASFTVTIADGKVTRINITTKTITVGEGEDAVSYTSVYAFSLSQWGTAEVDEEAVGPYKTTAAHTALKNALKTASEAKNYTVYVNEVELVWDENDALYEADELDYHVFVTEKAIYIDCENWEEGFVEVGNGDSKTVYPFTYDPETESGVLYDASVFPTIASMRASFNGFAPEIFVTDDDGAYVLRDELDTLETVHDVLINFGEGVDQIRLYAGYTFAVKFVLKDGALDQVELYYYVGDGIFRRTLTYGDWDDTTIDIDFDNFETKSVLDDYAGTYTDGTVTAVITGDGIVINDKPYEVTEYSIQYDMFTGEWNDEVWYITKQGEKQLLLFYVGEDEDDDVTYTLTSTAIDPVEIPEEFGGVWNKNSNTVAIAYDIVQYNGAMLTVLSYDEKDGSLYATDGEKTYRMFAEDDKNGNPVLLVIVYVDGLSTAYYDMTKVDDAVIVPEVLIGTYEKLDYTYGQFNVVVGLTSVQMEIGGVVQEVALLSAEELTSWGVKVQAIVIDVNGKEYYLVEGGSNATVTLEREEDRFSVTLNRVQTEQPPTPSVEIPEAFHGTFVGEDDDGVEYTVTITANGVAVSIDGVAQTVVIEEFDEYEGFSLKVNGVTSYIYQYGYGDEINAIGFYNDNCEVTLSRTAIEIPESLYGTYEGNDYFAGKVSVVISQNGLTVTIGNGDTVVAEIKSVGMVDDGWGGKVLSIGFLLDGNQYSISEGYEGALNIYSDFDSGNTVQTTLSPVGGDEEESARDKYNGTFEGEKDGVTYSIVITADGVAVSIDGVAKTVSVEEFDDYEGFTVKVDNVAYYIYQYGYDEDINVIVLANSSLQVTLSRATAGDDDVTIPDELVGTYEGTDIVSEKSIRVVVTKDGVEVYIDNVAKTVIVEKVEDGWYGAELYILVDELECVFGPYRSIYSIASAEDNGDSLFADLTKSTTGGDEVTIPEKFYGEFATADESYMISIDEDGIYVLSDDVEGDAVIVEYDDYEGFTVTIGDDTYYIQQVGYDDEITKIRIMTTDYTTVNVVLDRVTQSGGDDEVTIPEAFYGYFANEDLSYLITIDENGIFVIMDDGDEIQAVIVDYDEYEGFTVTIDGDVYYIMNASYTDNSVPQVAFMSSDYRTLNMVLDRVEE